MKKITIKVNEVLGNDIRTRARIFELTSRMGDSDECVLDFEGVTFISRSFADELISMKDAISRTIKFNNLNDELNTLMQIVERGRNSKFRPEESGPIIVLNTMHDLECYLTRI